MSAEGFEAVDEAVVGESLYVENYSSFAIVRYVGTTEFSKGIWVGLELPTPTGKNDGSVKGQRYFPCEPQHGIFVRLSACTRPRQRTGAAASSTPTQTESEGTITPLLPPVPPTEERAVAGALAGLQVRLTELMSRSCSLPQLCALGVGELNRPCRGGIGLLR